MNAEQILTDELGAVARSLPTPPAPDLAALVDRAERDTRRSVRKAVAVSVAVAAAVVTAVLLGGHLTKPDASPPPDPAPQPTPTPGVLRTGEPIRTWVDQTGRLHLDGTTVAGSYYANAQTTGDLTTATTGQYDTGTTVVFLGTRRVGTLHDSYEGGNIAVSPDARTLAYTAFENPTRTRTSIVVVRVDEDGLTELGRLPIDSISAAGDPGPGRRLAQVRDDGTVIYAGLAGQPAHQWKPGGEVLKVDVPLRLPAVDERFLNTTDTWAAWQTDPNPETAAAGVTYRSVTVQQPGRTSTRHTFTFGNRYAYTNIVTWETQTDVLLYGDRNPPGRTSDGEYVRCNVETDTCEVAPAPGDDGP